jgi:hypothetical protein
MLAAEPIENTEAREPADPIDRIEPAEPIDRIEPAEPIDRIEPLDPMLRMEPEDPAERDEPGEVRIAPFCCRGRSGCYPAGLAAAHGTLIGAGSLKPLGLMTERVIPAAARFWPAAGQALAVSAPGGPARIVGTYSSSWMRPSKVRLLVISSATSG